MLNTIEFLWTGPENGPGTVLLAHGAGAPMDSPFMDDIAGGLADAGLRTGRFEFPYMTKRRADGKRRPPDREPVLLESWRAAVAACGPAGSLVIGGKSMGGRMASLVADELGVAGLVCLGYPFHPPGKPERLRTAHLLDLKTPALICQGARDPFGTQEEVPGYGLAAGINICWLPDGDHNLKPRKASGLTHEVNLAATVAAIDAFVRGL